MADALSQEWARLDPEEYPGAGPTGVTADGVIDPLLAFAYDSIFVAAAAAEVREGRGKGKGGGGLPFLPFFCKGRGGRCLLSWLFFLPYIALAVPRSSPLVVVCAYKPPVLL